MSKKKNGLITIISGILLFLTGVIIVPALAILPLILGDSEPQQFIIPGTAEVTAEETGRYYLWHDYQTVYQGTTYHHSKDLPHGLDIEIHDLSGAPLNFTSNTSFSSKIGNSAKHSIGHVEVEQPGKLTVSVSGDAAPRVFSFAKSGIARIIGLIFGTIALSVLLALSGIGILIWGIVVLASERPTRQVPERSTP